MKVCVCVCVSLICKLESSILCTFSNPFPFMSPFLPYHSLSHLFVPFFLFPSLPCSFILFLVFTSPFGAVSFSFPILIYSLFSLLFSSLSSHVSPLPLPLSFRYHFLFHLSPPTFAFPDFQCSRLFLPFFLSPPFVILFLISFLSSCFLILFLHCIPSFLYLFLNSAFLSFSLSTSLSIFYLFFFRAHSPSLSPLLRPIFCSSVHFLSTLSFSFKITIGSFS